MSPGKLSILTALALSIPASVVFFIFEKNIAAAIIFFVLLLTASYFLIQFVLERFIYRKIKLIYKLIHHTKATKKEEMYFKYILPKKSIDEVREDVEAWAQANAHELELLRNNEQFRKEFLQNLSHEFKTPVFAIQGYVETLLGGAMYNESLNKNFLEKTASNVERLSNLINDLDSISKLERGEWNLVKQQFTIQDLIKETFESLSIVAQPKNIQCQIKKGCEPPLYVFADKEKIRQVLVNLIENSIKYGKENGHIQAGIYKVDDTSILVEISDDGIGIGGQNLSRIFERFYRTEQGRSIDVKGSGLGLAICKHIIEAHNHSMHVRSTPEIGTTIGFTLDEKK